MSTPAFRSFSLSNVLGSGLLGSLARLAQPTPERTARTGRHPIGFCSVHGVFPAEALRVWPEPLEIPLSKLRVTCPTCERACVLLPGPYERTDDRFNILFDPSTSSEALQALSRTLSASEEGELSPEEAMFRARQIAPDIAGIFDFPNWNSEVKRALIAAIDTIVARRQSHPASLDKGSMRSAQFEPTNPATRSGGPALLTIALIGAMLYLAGRLGIALWTLAFG